MEAGRLADDFFFSTSLAVLFAPVAPGLVDNVLSALSSLGYLLAVVVDDLEETPTLLVVFAFLSAWTTSVTLPALILCFKLSSIGSLSLSPTGPFFFATPDVFEVAPVLAGIVDFGLSVFSVVMVDCFLSSLVEKPVLLSLDLVAVVVVLISPSFLASAAEITDVGPPALILRAIC